MIKAARIGAVLLAVAAILRADDWPSARVMTIFSDDGGRFVRIEPGESVGDLVGFAGAARGRFASALFYQRQPDRSYRVAAEVSLLNPVAPVDLLLSNSGHLVAFDNWHNMGFGEAVVIYDPAGRPLASLELEQLYTPERLESIPRSVSSRWWRCKNFGFVDPTEQTRVYVHEALGGTFVFELSSGTFTYSPGTAQCQPAGSQLSATFLGS